MSQHKRKTLLEGQNETEYYHDERTHQRVGNRTLDAVDEPVILHFPERGEVLCHERLGGPLKSFSRKDA